MLLSMCCSSMDLPVSSALRGYLNLILRFCAADPQSKKSGAAVALSQSKKLESFGGIGTVYNNRS